MSVSPVTATLPGSSMSKLPALFQVQNVQFLLEQGPDMINRHLRGGQYWESLLLTILTHFLSKMPQAVFIDIGANLGAITIPIGHYLQGRQGKVVSIEAQRSVYYQLCGNIFANRLTSVCTAYHVAVSDKNGEIDVPVLDVTREHNLGSLSLDKQIRSEQGTLSTQITEFETVKLSKLDAMDLPLASIIKIDVEGLELEVLRGGLGWIKNSGNPPILFEVWGDYMKNQISKREQLFEFIKTKLGYQWFIIGELCIAQHPDNQYIAFSQDKQKQEIQMTMLR